ncbi:MAG: DUF2116 family Zn-ribbon domain-containing protein [Candidatus Helarchaeota archaeon]|nr:DUF2116 family Zn-ribbon domain-containing protein [Candidatus Helarchaeota archaeon]
MKNSLQTKFKYRRAYFEFEKRIQKLEIYISGRRPIITEKRWKFRHLTEAQETYIYPHYHCAKCDAIIVKGTEYSKKLVGQKGYPGWDYFCSKECGELLKKDEKSKKRSKWWTILIIVGYIIIMVVIILVFI